MPFPRSAVLMVVLTTVVFAGCGRSDAKLKVGTTLRVCEIGAKMYKRKISQVHPTTPLSKLSRANGYVGKLMDYAAFMAVLEMEFDVTISHRLFQNTSQANFPAIAIGKITMHEIAEAVDEAKATRANAEAD